jgi:ubiquinone/menaquinone biosynthesis C-methylase UbiE
MSNYDALKRDDQAGCPPKRRGNYIMTHNFNWALFDVLLRYLKPAEGEAILDMGCSRGFYVRALEAYTSRALGVDISEASLRDAVTTKVVYGDTTSLKFPDASFDKAYSLHTIEHIPNLADFFAEMARILKPGGTAIVVYPWEPFRGFQAIVAAMRQHHNPLMARQIHVHRLTPKNILGFVRGTPLIHVESRLTLAMGIQYLTVFTKKG